MEGFFTKKQTESKSRPNGKKLSCTSCGLYKDCNSPRMEPFGNFKKGILNIGEAPGQVEDERGKPWQGKTGRLLQQTYKRLGIDLFEDCLNINACHCRPIDDKGNNRTPSNYEIECCRRSTLGIIEEYKPKVIVVLGNAALFSLLGHRWKKDLGGITKWRGWTIPDQDFHAWICPTFHPSYVERSHDGVENLIWTQDLKQALEKIKDPLPEYIEPEIEIIEDLSLLNYKTIHSSTMGNNKIRNLLKLIAFDYETTGKKPHAEGHRIVCVSVADSPNHVYAFMMPRSKRDRQPFLDLLANKNIAKMAHNIKFEQTWSKVRLKQTVRNWKWDSMQAAHILDNRRGVSGLKFQTYVNFGIVDYASEIAPYLESIDNKNGNSLNRIDELLKKPGGKEMLLKYNALDSIYEYRLALIQQWIIGCADLPF